MDALIYAIFFFVILIPLVLGMVAPMLKKHYKTTDAVMNYDIYMRKFVYKVPLKRDEIIEALRYTDDIDELSCSFDFERSAVVISEYGSSREYYFYIDEYDGYSILKLEQVALIGMSSHIQYKLNPFMVSKLHARLVPFSQYAF